jgi:hypothetical protein
MYYRDSTAGTFLGADIIYTTAPVGSPITGVDRTKFAPANYPVPGYWSGDTTVQTPLSLVYIVYRRPV